MDFSYECNLSVDEYLYGNRCPIIRRCGKLDGSVTDGTWYGYRHILCTHDSVTDDYNISFKMLDFGEAMVPVYDVGGLLLPSICGQFVFNAYDYNDNEGVRDFPKSSLIGSFVFKVKHLDEYRYVVRNYRDLLVECSFKKLEPLSPIGYNYTLVNEKNPYAQYVYFCSKEMCLCTNCKVFGSGCRLFPCNEKINHMLRNDFIEMKRVVKYSIPGVDFLMTGIFDLLDLLTVFVCDVVVQLSREILMTIRRLCVEFYEDLSFQYGDISFSSLILAVLDFFVYLDLLVPFVISFMVFMLSRSKYISFVVFMFSWLVVASSVLLDIDVYKCPYDRGVIIDYDQIFYYDCKDRCYIFYSHYDFLGDFKLGVQANLTVRLSSRIFDLPINKVIPFGDLGRYTVCKPSMVECAHFKKIVKFIRNFSGFILGTCTSFRYSGRC